ncbi:hypothetical protein [Shewanella algae]|uniref:hypothetical protein n=1 Tax=Shewanella algae TaxID=38313 RepID=UPI0034D68820
MEQNKTTHQLIFSFGKEDDQNHQLSLATYISSLQGLQDVVVQADKILNGEHSEFEMKVVAEQPGSFQSVIDFVQSGGIDVLQTLGFVAGGFALGTVVEVLEKLNGRPMVEIEIKKGEHGREARIQVDGEELVCSESVSKLVKNPKIRHGLDALLYSSLQSDDTSYLKIKSQGEVELEVNKPQSEIYKVPATVMHKETDVETIIADVRFTKVNFIGAKGWEILYGSHGKFPTQMEDEFFLERIAQGKDGKPFEISSDDNFVVEMTKTDVTTNGKRGRPRFVVNKVIRHRKADGRIV